MSELVTKPIVIEDRVWCGANVTITKGVPAKVIRDMKENHC